MSAIKNKPRKLIVNWLYSEKDGMYQPIYKCELDRIAKSIKADGFKQKLNLIVEDERFDSQYNRDVFLRYYEIVKN